MHYNVYKYRVTPVHPRTAHGVCLLLAMNTLLRQSATIGCFAVLFSALAAGVAYSTPADDALHRGHAAMNKDDIDAAIAAFSEAIRLDPKSAEAYLARGWAYSEKDEAEKAIADYSQAIRIEPNNAEAWCNRGLAIARQGDHQKGLPDLNEALRLDPKLTEGYSARGWVYSETGQFAKAVADYSEVIRLDPEELSARVDRATCLAALKKHAEAIADLDIVIGRNAKEPKYFGARGAAHLRLGNYRQGAADLQAAIRLNPTDAGVKYQPSSNKELSPEALKHGEEQVGRMVRDRPAMAQFGKESDFLRQWAARKFAGEDFGEPFDWDPAPPKDSDAENVAPTGGRRACIRVEPLYSAGPDKGKPRGFEELWAGAAFELHNITFAREFLRLHQEAGDGKLTKEQFVADIWKYEYLAAQRTRAFYVQVFLPWAEKQKLSTDPGLWFAAWWESAADTLAGFADKTAYPWRPYARQFDWMTVHRLYHDGKFRKTLSLLEAMQTEKIYTHDAADVQCWIGRCHFEMNKPALAVAAFTRAIQLDPKNAAAYELRGEAYRELGEKAKAKADLAKAKALAAGRE
jgi:tetratricopeptide (TPR) repeat protein